MILQLARFSLKFSYQIWWQAHSIFLDLCLLVSFIITQKDNVANQREHLILLLANVHIRQFPKPDQQPKVFPFPCYYILGICFVSFFPLVHYETVNDGQVLLLSSSFWFSFEFFFSLFCIWEGSCYMFLAISFSLFSWMIEHWQMWWRSFSRTTKDGASTWIGKVVFGKA